MASALKKKYDDKARGRAKLLPRKRLKRRREFIRIVLRRVGGIRR